VISIGVFATAGARAWPEFSPWPADFAALPGVDCAQIAAPMQKIVIKAETFRDLIFSPGEEQKQCSGS